jgi:hypothetical protein
VRLALDAGPAAVQRVRIEIHDLERQDVAKIHIREIDLH